VQQRLVGASVDRATPKRGWTRRRRHSAGWLVRIQRPRVSPGNSFMKLRQETIRAQPRPNSMNSSSSSTAFTRSEQAAEVFNRVKPKLAVYAHAPVSEGFNRGNPEHLLGPSRGADDMMTIEVGSRIEVRRFVR
jgi:hypothetical protein